MSELKVDQDTMRVAILITIKKNVDKLFATAQKEPDLLVAAQLYRDIGSELERGDAQIKSLNIQEK